MDWLYRRVFKPMQVLSQQEHPSIRIDERKLARLVADELKAIKERRLATELATTDALSAPNLRPLVEPSQ